MKLFLIRHGETVDNVAGLYAGVRDSALTNHGVDQAARLGKYFFNAGIKLTHIFSSPLSRAVKTAEALQSAHQVAGQGDHVPNKNVEIVKVTNLIEQDFGFYEGKPFSARAEPKMTGREAGHEKHRGQPGFVDVESRQSMDKRAHDFLDNHLLPLCVEETANDEVLVAVVSHGMLLAHLWRKLLLRLPRKSLTIAPEITATRGNLILEHLGGWSNTGYLELLLRRSVELDHHATPSRAILSTPAADVTIAGATVPPAIKAQDATTSLPTSPSEVANSAQQLETAPKTLHGWSTTILAIDSKQHLVGLKRQRGGIGRLAHDKDQKKLDCFFKRQKTS